MYMSCNGLQNASALSENDRLDLMVKIWTYMKQKTLSMKCLNWVLCNVATIASLVL